MIENMRNRGDPWGRRIRLALMGFAVIGGFFLIAEHRAHVLPYLPLLLLAACPLLHMFMHGGHHHASHGEHSGAQPAPEERTADPVSSGKRGGDDRAPTAAPLPSGHSRHQGGRL